MLGNPLDVTEAGQQISRRRLKPSQNADCDLNAADSKATRLNTSGMPKLPTQDVPRASARTVLATNLVLMRRQRGWSQEDLAAEAGLHRTFVAHVERQSRNISLDNLERLADALGVRIHRLLLPRAAAE